MSKCQISKNLFPQVVHTILMLKTNASLKQGWSSPFHTFQRHTKRYLTTRTTKASWTWT